MPARADGTGEPVGERVVQDIDRKGRPSHPDDEHLADRRRGLPCHQRADPRPEFAGWESGVV